jgi:hypothetical protein
LPTTLIAPGTIQSTSTLTVGTGTAGWSINGSGANMSFSAPGGRVVTLTGGTGTKTVAFDDEVTPKYAGVITQSATTLTLTDAHVNNVINVTNTSVTTFTLSSGLTIGSQITIIRSGNTTNNVVVNRSGSETINGATSITFSGQYNGITLVKVSSTA